MNIVCLITLRPNEIWCDLLNGFSKYKIFIIVDDNNFDLSNYKQKYENINFIQIDNEKCKLHGYINCNHTLKKLISGWDKALYYFGVEYKTYDYSWFIEDDVFLHNEDTLTKIDHQYTNDDLLSNVYQTTERKTNYWQHWHRIKIQQYTPPYYRCMVCAVRFSKNMMKFINDYAIQYNTLFFIEALFPTIAIKNNLKYNNPIQLKNIYYKHEFKIENINKNNLYHPMKDFKKHIDLRNLL